VEEGLKSSGYLVTLQCGSRTIYALHFELPYCLYVFFTFVLYAMMSPALLLIFKLYVIVTRTFLCKAGSPLAGILKGLW
jgi:hypothetical protein